MHMTGLVRVGKGRRHNMSIMQMQGAHGVCALRALVIHETVSSNLKVIQFPVIRLKYTVSC